MTGFIERVLSVQTLNNKRGCTQRVIVVNDVAQQFDDMPTPSADTLGLIVQYTGETTADFTHGYFYEGTSSTTSSSATATQTVGSSLTDIAVDVETLETFTGWTTDNSLQIFYTDDGWSVDTTSLGVTYTGTPSVGDAITISYTAGVTTYGWQQVDVQPSGGDQHNLGWYATESALTTAHPTATDGDFAIVGSTDTVWTWDSDTSAWVDTDQKGQVTSVNGQTGAVVLSIPDAVQYSTMPTASSSNVDDIVQFIGTTDANYTNGYFYKCVSDGQTPATYSWSAVQVQASSGGLPSQTGQSGKFLTTDGTDASWGTINALQNTATGTGSLAINTSDPVVGSESVVINGYYGSIDTSSCAVVIGGRISSSQTSPYLNPSVVVGYGAIVSDGAQYNVVIGGEAESSKSNNVCIGYHAIVNDGSKCILLNASGNNSRVDANNAILFDVSTYGAYNNDANTVKIANANGNFEMMSADGTIPEARLADTTNAQQGDVLTLDANGNAVWQAGGSGGGISDVTVNGTSVVSGGVATITMPTIDDTSTSSQTATWSASKLNTTIGDIETLINAL